MNTPRRVRRQLKARTTGHSRSLAPYVLLARHFALFLSSSVRYLIVYFQSHARECLSLPDDDAAAEIAREISIYRVSVICLLDVQVINHRASLRRHAGNRLKSSIASHPS